MSRFSSIIETLRVDRIELLKSSKKRRKKGSSKPKRKEKLSFDSPELEKIFNKMPKDMQDYIKGKG